MATILEVSDEAIDRAIEVVDGGGLAVLPTMTNYNIICDATHAGAVARVFEVKARTKLGPLPLNVRDVDQLVAFADVPQTVDLDALAALWPTELSLIFPERHPFPSQLTCGLHTVACSQTAHPVFAAVQAAIDRPLAGSSANRSGFATPVVTFDIAREHVGDGVDLILDGGPTPAEASGDDRPIVNTIVDLTFTPPMLCREGWFPLARVRELFDDLVVDPDRYRAALQERQRAAAT